MNKNDLINAVAQKAGISKNDSEKAVNAAIETITESLSRGEAVKIVGFGTFDVKNRAARTGRNPKTNEPIVIPASKAPAFKAGKDLKDSICF